jgi:hypothetical protein
MGQSLGFLGLGGVKDLLFDLRDRLGAGTHRDADRILQILGSDLLDVVRNGRRKEQGLAVPRQFFADLSQLGREPHIEHAVGLIQDQEAGRAEHQRTTVQMVDDAARRANDQTRFAGQGAELGAHVGAADQKSDGPQRLSPGEFLQHSRDLHGQFARWGQDQSHLFRVLR